MADENDELCGFEVSNFSDHEFTRWLDSLDPDWTTGKHGSLCAQFKANGQTVAFVFYDNAKPSRTIWIKEK